MFDRNGSRFDNVLLVRQYRISDSKCLWHNLICSIDFISSYKARNMSIFRETVAYITIGTNETTFKFKLGESNERIWKGIYYNIS